MNKGNITLIGMAGVGKSTVGVLLADFLGWNFVDIDSLLEKQEGKRLQIILSEIGDDAFKVLEVEKIQEQKDVHHTVLSPGGSLVYSETAMRLLKEISSIVYLEADIETILERIEPKSRGIVGLGSKSIVDIYSERAVLYEQYADMRIDIVGKNPEQIAGEIKVWKEIQDLQS